MTVSWDDYSQYMESHKKCSKPPTRIILGKKSCTSWWLLVTIGIPMKHCKEWGYNEINHLPTGAEFLPSTVHSRTCTAGVASQGKLDGEGLNMTQQTCKDLQEMDEHLQRKWTIHLGRMDVSTKQNDVEQQLQMVRIGGSVNGSTPIADGFLSWNIPIKNGWFRGTPIYGNLQIGILWTMAYHHPQWNR